MTATVLPPTCRRLCRDDEETLRSKYLRDDYSVPSQREKDKRFLVVAYISSTYSFALPAVSFIALWRARLATEDTGTSHDLVFCRTIISGLGVFLENYKTNSWCWELVEMTRKVILTSGLILVGQERRSSIGLALIGYR